MRRVLVTGGAGFIGSHLSDELLRRGFEVVVFDNLSTGSRDHVNPAVTFVQGDVRDDVRLRRVFELGLDVVCHIAGQASVRRSFDDPAEDLGVNVVGTLNILNCCAGFSVPRLLYASSMTVYGDPEQIPTPESAPPCPLSFYGVTKATAERYVHLYAARTDLKQPLHATSFRMFNVYGPRQSLTNPYQGVLAIFLGNALRGEPITIHSDGEQARDLVFIDDVVRAWADAIDEPAARGQVYNLGRGEPTSVNALCDAVLNQVGETRSSNRVRYGPAQQGDVRRSVADISAARQDLGWAPRVSLDEGMEATVRWARSAGSRLK